MNIKTKSQSGFTIVELLIVVVVIAILAAITLVSFNNITNRANDSAAKETASNVQKKIELYNAENSAYPTTLTQLRDSGKSWEVPTSVKLNGTTANNVDPTASTGKDTVKLQACGAGKGVIITFYEYNKSPAGTSTITIGDGTSCTTFGA